MVWTVWSCQAPRTLSPAPSSLLSSPRLEATGMHWPQAPSSTSLMAPNGDSAAHQDVIGRAVHHKRRVPPDLLSQRTPVSWTAVILGHVKSGRHVVALDRYRQMQHDGVQPDKHIMISLMKACGSLRDLEQGKLLHAQVVAMRFDSDVRVATTLIDMFAKCGSMEDAKRVFDSLGNRDVAAWNAIISGYAQQGQGEQALQLYARMRMMEVRPNSRTFLGVLKACSRLAAVEEAILVHGHAVKVNAMQRGEVIHTQIVKAGFESDPFVASALIDMLAKCGNMVDARNVFEALSRRDVVSWNALIAGYVQRHEHEMALQVYARMQREGMKPSCRTFVSVLKACAGRAAAEEDAVIVDGQAVKAHALQEGRIIHGEAVEMGAVADIFVVNTLVDMYANCGDMVTAREVFEALPRRDVVSWNALLEGYAEQSQGDKAFELFVRMQEEDVKPNQRTFVSMLKACSSSATTEEDTVVNGQSLKLESLKRGRDIHVRAIKEGYEADLFVVNTLIHMYATCGSMVDARQVFDTMPDRNVISWNAMIAGYVLQDEGVNAMQLYAEMQVGSVKANEGTYVCILKACRIIGAIRMCAKIHQDIIATGIEPTPVLATTLIDAYATCGAMVEARTVFDNLPHQDAVAWSAVMAGYARQGEWNTCLQCFQEMQQAGIKANGFALLSVLNACSHAGMVEEGLKYFDLMSRDPTITPTADHYVTLIDLLGRAGLLDQVQDLLSKMPVEPNLSMWLCLLAACRKHNKVALGRWAFDRAVSLQPKHCSPYVLMSNIYAEAEMWEDAHKVKEMRGSAGAWKKPGRSWIEHGETMHFFMVGDQSHAASADVYSKLRHIDGELKDKSSKK